MTSIDVETRLVQLSSAATTFNTTLNLTGPIILGVTIAFGSLLYAYSKAYPPQLSVAGNIGLLSDSLSSLAKPSGGYGRGYTKRAAEERDQEQEAALGAVLDTFSLLQSVEDSLALIGVDTADCQLRAVCDIVAGTFPAPAVDTVTQVLPIGCIIFHVKQFALPTSSNILFNPRWCGWRCPSCGECSCRWCSPCCGPGCWRPRRGSAGSGAAPATDTAGTRDTGTS